MNRVMAGRRALVPSKISLTGNWLPCWPPPARRLPHIAMSDGKTIYFGRYSTVSQTWQAWNGHEYVVIWPHWYMELPDAKVRWR